MKITHILILFVLVTAICSVNSLDDYYQGGQRQYTQEEEEFLYETRFSVSHLANSAEDLYGSLTLEKLSALTPEERGKLQDLAKKAKALKIELDMARSKIDLGPMAVDY